MATAADKRVAITGATSGIGLAAARAFAAEGARMALIARSEGLLGSLADELARSRGSAEAIAADIGETGAAERAIDQAALKLGGLDVVVVNAAASAYGPFETIEDRDFRRTIEVSLLGAVATVRCALPHLERSGGVLIVTGSIVRDVPMPFFSPYIAAKAGLRGFLDTLRAELRDGGSSVDVCIVEPGAVDTPFWKKVKSSIGEVPPVPIGAVQPEQVATEIVKRASDRRATTVVGPFAKVQASVASKIPWLIDRILPLAVRYFKREATPTDGGQEALWATTEEARGSRSRQ